MSERPHSYQPLLLITQKMYRNRNGKAIDLDDYVP